MKIAPSSHKRKLSELEPGDDSVNNPLPVKRSHEKFLSELDTNPVDTINGDFTSQEGANNVFALLEDSHEDGVSDHILTDSSPSGNNVFTPPSTDGSEETAPSPVVWAKTRSGLCDALPYFRSHEGGNYHIDHVTRGLLLDSDGSPRDYMDGTVIITTVGGGRVTVDGDERKQRVDDQDANAPQYRYLRATTGVPDGKVPNDTSPIPPRTVMVIAGKRKLGMEGNREYCVLGEYQVTDLWLEKFPNSEASEVTPEDTSEEASERASEKTFKSLAASWMVRLEKVKFNEPSWFMMESTSHSLSAGQYTCPSFKCTECNETSKVIYNKGWACLNNPCDEAYKFLVTSNGQTKRRYLKFNEIQYSIEFLYERSFLPANAVRQDIIPPLPTIDANTSYGTEAEFKRGVVCPLCYCCSRRIFWNGWKCENTESCSFTHTLETQPYPLEEIETETKKVKSKKIYGVSYDEKLVTRHDRHIDGYEMEIYTFPGEQDQICGAAVVLRATKEICAKENGPDALYLSMQDPTVDLKLQRKAARHRGENSTAEIDSILRGVAQLTWAQEKMIEQTASLFEEKAVKFSSKSMTFESKAFNELLALGYFESSTISYHDDGEKDLGPTVATLSLGSPSIMRFRPKKKSPIGEDGKKKKKTPNSTDSKRRGGNKAAVISIPLFHGDIVIMHGTELQKHYEHEVKPKGKLRFAMTSRYIKTSESWSAEATKEIMEKSKLPEDIEKMAYGGVNTNTKE
ncbi:hypothetical protein E8E14_001335 [Neopestalotiopsis sp. 37M]|nr:hypothetical protein E8E14_001335 [Neopestalotiopsis sp. 37M]